MKISKIFETLSAFDDFLSLFLMFGHFIINFLGFNSATEETWNDEKQESANVGD